MPGDRPLSVGSGNLSPSRRPRVREQPGSEFSTGVRELIVRVLEPGLRFQQIGNRKHRAAIAFLVFGEVLLCLRDRFLAQENPLVRFCQAMPCFFHL